MPFTIDGQWIPSPTEKPQKKPVKVRLAKRGKNIVTLVLNLDLPDKELAALVSQMKKCLGCGGAIKEEGVELQGDKVASVISFLKKLSIKTF
ncbi:putative protein YciH [Chlamydiales bacterium STE3]|nr:putative protein YciH [Chlamydiales bacterium STE3]